MNPVTIAPGYRPMTGLLHQGEPSESACAVLLANPFGQEAVRAHRLYRILAERLARAGHMVLRFDYHGTGDSAGDERDGDLSRWRDDLLAADAFLNGQAPARARIWFGLRLGATIAIQASQHADSAPTGLLLWAPVIDGSAWLDDLRRAHSRHMQAAYAMSSQAIARFTGESPAAANESQGFELSTSLLAELRALGPDSIGSAHARRAGLIAPVDRLAALEPLVVDIPAQQLAFDGIDWNTEEASNSALAPPALLNWVEQFCGKIGATQQ